MLGGTMKQYRCEIYDNRHDENSFAVALLPVPDFPNDKPFDDVVRKPLQAVIAANDANGMWSFVQLEVDEKHCIGDRLNEIGVPEGEWKYCNLFST
jgi:hypothetical protein